MGRYTDLHTVPLPLPLPLLQLTRQFSVTTDPYPPTVYTRNSSGDEIAKRDLMIAYSNSLTTPFLFNPLGGGDPLGRSS